MIPLAVLEEVGLAFGAISALFLVMMIWHRPSAATKLPMILKVAVFCGVIFSVPISAGFLFIAMLEVTGTVANMFLILLFSFVFAAAFSVLVTTDRVFDRINEFAAINPDIKADFSENGQ